MKIEQIKTIRGFRDEDYTYKYSSEEWTAWKYQYGITIWDKIPDELNPRHFHGTVYMQELMSMTDDQIRALKQGALERTKTEIREREI
jgi:hypothetical protein